jgi:autophagy-related protein 13
MRESNAVLSDSLSSSLLLQRSSSSSSRQLSSVPPMVAGISTSIPSSPGERISPRTPHTPAIPSRLSANSIIEYNERERGAGRHRASGSEDVHIEGDEGESAERTRLAGAIDIPTSPRPFHPSYRRSSSVAQQHRPQLLDDELGEVLPFGLRSASMGDGEEREPLSINALLGMQEGPSGTRVDSGDATASIPMSRQRSSDQDGREEDRPPSARGFPYRPRLGRGSGRGSTPPQGSSTPMSGDRGSAPGGAAPDGRGARNSFTRPPSTLEDDEPLLFAMSDFGHLQQSRRSIEDGRGGSGATGTSERGGTDSASSSRRSSRRGARGWA